jgi:hypothetical protein
MTEKRTTQQKSTTTPKAAEKKLAVTRPAAGKGATPKGMSVAREAPARPGVAKTATTRAAKPDKAAVAKAAPGARTAPAKRSPKKDALAKPDAAKATTIKEPATAAVSPVVTIATAVKQAEKKPVEKKPVKEKPVDKKAAAPAVQPATETSTPAPEPADKPAAEKPTPAKPTPEKAPAKTSAKMPAKALAEKPTATSEEPSAVVPEGSSATAPVAKPAATTAEPAKTPSAAKRPTSRKKASASTNRQIAFDTSEDRSAVASQALEDVVILVRLVENLSGPQRRVRQFSAAAVNEIAAQQPEELVAYVGDIVDALHRPEAQTRWECLEALSSIVGHAPSSCEQALHGAEISLYDEESGTARLAALRFLCAYGALDARRAQKVWPLIAEALQCYHGDPEFQDMLISVTHFAAGKIGKTVKAALVARMEFDAKNSKSSIGRRAREIVELCL